MIGTSPRAPFAANVESIDASASRALAASPRNAPTALARPHSHARRSAVGDDRGARARTQSDARSTARRRAPTPSRRLDRRGARRPCASPLIAIGASAASAASATSVCQNRSNAETERSRKRHASSAPLTIKRPAPTCDAHTIGRAPAPRADRHGLRAVGKRRRPRELGGAHRVARRANRHDRSRLCRCCRSPSSSYRAVVSYGPGARRSSSITTLPPRRRRNASRPATSRSPSASGAPTITASNSSSAARSSRRPGGCPASVLTLRDVTTRLVTTKRGSLSTARRTNVDIQLGRGSKNSTAQRVSRTSTPTSAIAVSAPPSDALHAKRASAPAAVGTK